MAESDTTARLYQHSHHILTSHAALLRDAKRNRKFYRALKRLVTDGCSVLDIGSGTGVWAIAAARLGAKRVVAVEREPLLLGLIQALARQNGVADRVEVVAGDSRQVALGKDFDVIVSETIGHLVFDEDVISVLMDARERFLKPGGHLIPAAVALRVAAARLRHKRLPAGLRLDWGQFESLSLDAPVALGGKMPWRMVGIPADLIRVDLTQIAAPPDVGDLTARWPGQDATRINCFAVWVEAALAPGVDLVTPRTTSWSALGYRISPFRERLGDLEFKLALTSATHDWTAILSSEQSREVQSYSPARAATALVAAARSGPDAFSLFPQMGLATT